MNIVKITEDFEKIDEGKLSENDIRQIISKCKKYKAKKKEYKEILNFLLSDLDRIFEYQVENDIIKYLNSIKFHILEDLGFHEDAMKLKINFYQRGGKFPKLPMTDLRSFLLPQIKGANPPCLKF